MSQPVACFAPHLLAHAAAESELRRQIAALSVGSLGSLRDFSAHVDHFSEQPFLRDHTVLAAAFTVDGRSFECAASNMDPKAAVRALVGELIERYVAMTAQAPGSRQVRARKDFRASDGEIFDVDSFLGEPVDALAYPYAATWPDDRELEWIRGRSIETDSSVWIPAALAAPSEARHLRLGEQTSIGIASHLREDVALEAAASEIVERAVLRALWFGLGGCSHEATHCSPGGWRDDVFLAQVNARSLYLVLSVNREHGLYATGSGCAPEQHAAAARAHAQAESSQAKLSAMIHRAAARPAAVASFLDHQLWYRGDHLERVLDFRDRLLSDGQDAGALEAAASLAGAVAITLVRDPRPVVRVLAPLAQSMEAEHRSARLAPVIARQRRAALNLQAHPFG